MLGRMDLHELTRLLLEGLEQLKALADCRPWPTAARGPDLVVVVGAVLLLWIQRCSYGGAPASAALRPCPRGLARRRRSLNRLPAVEPPAGGAEAGRRAERPRRPAETELAPPPAPVEPTREPTPAPVAVEPDAAARAACPSSRASPSRRRPRPSLAAPAPAAPPRIRARAARAPAAARARPWSVGSSSVLGGRQVDAELLEELEARAVHRGSRRADGREPARDGARGGRRGRRRRACARCCASAIAREAAKRRARRRRRARHARASLT